MTEPFTMARASETLKKLMDHFEEALQVTIETGYWKDTVACDRIVTEYGNSISDAFRSGKFSGDAEKALTMWTELTTLESDYRRDQMALVRSKVAPPDPGLWWMELECHPKAPPDDVMKAFVKKMEECDPDRVANAAPEIQQLAKDIEWRLTRAYDRYLSTRPQDGTDHHRDA